MSSEDSGIPNRDTSCVTLKHACDPHRFHSLASFGGDDDLFSSDFSDDQLKERLAHMAAWPTLVRV